MGSSFYLITGVSRGLGEGLARKLLNEGHTVFGIARSDNADLRAYSEQTPGTLVYRRFDLTKSQEIPSVIQEAFEHVGDKDYRDIILINNAGMVHPLGPAESYSPMETERNLKINLLAPILLTSEFLTRVQDLSFRTTVVFISSGAAEKLYFGRSAYCATKAGVERFVKVVAHELTQKGRTSRVYAVRPGVIDTDMQSICRATSEEQIMDTKQFIQLKEEGKLLPPEETAKLILRTITDSRVHHGAVVDIRELYPEEMPS